MLLNFRHPLGGCKMQELASMERIVGYPLQPVPESPLFRRLDRERITLLQRIHGPQRRAERDAQLIRAGDPAAALITVSRGCAFRYSLLPDGRRQILNFALPGDTIGLGGLLTGAPIYPVQAALAMVYSVISYQHAMELLAEASWFRDRALEALAQERAEAECTLTRLGQCTAEECVASVLLEFYNRLAVRGLAAGNTFLLDLTQQHLADSVGLTVVHLNRVLGRLRSRGLLATSGHRVTLLDVPALERLSLVPRHEIQAPAAARRP
jgi:CRP/FNR family transcriptional regulator, anaerobic regulatory protein